MNNVSVDHRYNSVIHSRTLRNINNIFSLSSKKVLDLGCGYGEYLAHFGKGSVGVTTTPEEVEHATARGLSVRLGNAEFLEELSFEEQFEAVWANNLFEHLLSPHEFLIKLKKQVTKNGILILGVPVVPFIPQLTAFKKFRGALASNHINFFTADTLRLTVERAGWHVKAIRPFIFKNTMLDTCISPLVPHLYVIAENDTSFRYPSKKVKEWSNDSRYLKLIESTKSI